VPVVTSVTDYGYTSKFTGLLSLDEANAWSDDVKRAVEGQGSFGQLIDLRGQRAQTEQVNGIIQESMAYVIKCGMQRSAVVMSSAVMKMQIQRLAKEAGMYAYERYFDESTQPEWESLALAWIVDGVDPDA
jgi:hypothetical protein